MERVRLGRTNLQVTRTAFGVLPLQRVGMDEAVRILRRAYEAGINFYDTARAYSDSEEKIGRALGRVRDKIIISTKTVATDRNGVLGDLETSLRKLRTDYVDILQLHNPAQLPDPGDPNSSYAGLVSAREKGMVRHLGITNHRRDLALRAVESGLFDTIQFPLCMISVDEDLALAAACSKSDLGMIAMKGLAGGLITNARAAFAFMRSLPGVVPIWGFQRMGELAEFIDLDADPPALDDDLKSAIENDRRELAADFCRACGYCLPCPAEIPIPMAARMRLCLRRMPHEQFLTKEWQEKMGRIRNCTKCRQCAERCPYGLDTPALLETMLEDYENFLRAHSA